MRTTKYTSEWIHDIFRHTTWQKMTGDAVVVTFDAFRKKSPLLHSDVNMDVVSEPCHGYGGEDEKFPKSVGNVLYINKNVTIDEPVSSFNHSPKTAYVALGDPNYLWYLDFYLNSFLGKNKMASEDVVEPGKSSTTNLKRLRNLLITRNKDVEPSCVFLQQVYTALENPDIWNNSDPLVKSAVLSCFRDLRDLIVFEMAIPEIFEEYEVRVINHWMELADEVSGTDSFEKKISLLINELFSINSPILDSINRMKTFRPEISAALMERFHAKN